MHIDTKLMEQLNSIITSYQQKICRHDRQLWEQSYETELFKRLNSVPRKVAKINTSLIDVDLFRGSAFSASKPQNGWLSVATVAWLRLVFFPFYYRWWLCSTCGWVFGLLSVLYTFQFGSLVICYSGFRQSQNAEMLTMADYITPYIMMYVLTIVHSHVTANYNIPLRHSPLTPNGKRTKVSRAQLSQSPPISEKLRKPDKSAFHQSRDDRQNSLQSLPKRWKEQLISVSASSSLPCHENLDKQFDSESEILQEAESWLDSRHLSRANEQRSAKGILESKSCENLRIGRASKVEFFQSSRTGSSDQCNPTQDIRSSGESLTAAHQSSATGGSLLTIVGSSFEEITLDHGLASQMDVKPESQNATELSEADVTECLSKELWSKSNVEAGEKGEHLLRTSETQTECQNSCYILSTLESNFDSQCCEDRSIADSNTSMSDTCNSSFISSAEDDDEDRAEADGGSRSHSGAKEPDQFDPEFNTDAVSSIRKRHKAPSSCKVVPSSGLSPSKRSLCQTLESGSQHGDEDTSIYADKWKRLEAAVSSDEDEADVKPGVKLRGLGTRQLIVRKSCLSRQRRALGGGSDEFLHQKVSSVDAANPQSFSRRIGTSDTDESGKKSQSLPFVKNVMASEQEDMATKRMLSARNLGQNNLERNSQTSAKKSAGNVTESSATGPGVSSLIGSMSSTTDRVSCMIWSAGGAVHKVDLTILDIGWTIVRAVNGQQERCDYMVLGIILSFAMMFTPPVYHLYHNLDHENQTSSCIYPNSTLFPSFSYASLILGSDIGQAAVLANGMVQRLFLSLLFFFLLSVAERTFKQRLLYAKYFCYLTSSRKAKKYDLPHFRLNKVRNIKTWLSLRSFLKKRGPQRSVESVVSSGFILAIILVSILCIELLQDYGHFLEHLSNWELVLWSMILGVYLLRFITLGTKINKKYRNLSVLITEQINLYLHMEQKPHKKSALMVANSVLKLAEGLLKELESPFKISGLSANPFLYNITKMVILSAFSAVLTELLGFKLKLYKIKIRS